MEQAYSVGTTNRYALLGDDDDDPGDIIAPATSKPEKEPSSIKAKSTKEVTKQTKNNKAKDNKEKPAPKQNKVVVLENVNKTSEKTNSTARPRQGGRFNDRERGNDRDRDRFNDRDHGDRQGEKLDNRTRQNEDYRPRGGRGGGRPRLSSREKDRENEFGGEDRPTRGRGRPFRDRGGGRGGGSRSGKREFERRSGSDKSSIKAVDKRDGGGAHNWGRQNDAAADDWPNEEPEAPQDVQEPVANGEALQEQKEQAESQEGEGEEVAQEPEEPKEMTLDEYKAKQSVEVLKPDSSLQRNVDNSQWKGTVALKKEEEDFFPGTREIIEKPKTSGRIKTTLDPNFYFRDPARRGRGRLGPGGRGGGPPREDRNAGGGGNRRNFDDNRREGGRGGGRRDFDGGRKEGDGRREFDGGRKEFESNRRDFDGGRRGFGGRGKNTRRDRAPNVEDESDFPSLGSGTF